MIAVTIKIAEKNRETPEHIMHGRKRQMKQN